MKKLKQIISDNIKEVIYFLIGLGIGLVIMFFVAPNRIIKFKNGSQVIVEFNDTKISIDELYKYYQDNTGLNTFLYMIDKQILKDKYLNLSKDASMYAKDQAEYYYKSYETNYKKSKEEFLSENGYTEETFLEFLEMNYYSEIYYVDYLKQFIKDSEIKKEYDNVFGEKYLYTFSSQDEKNDLEKVREDLKKGTSIDDIKKKYSNIIFNEIGNFTYNESNTFSDNILQNLKSLKANSCSKVVSDDSFGKVVLYVSTSKDKPKFDDAKEDIIKVLAERKARDDSSLYYKAFIELRKDANLKIKDKDLNKKYNEYIDNILK